MRAVIDSNILEDCGVIHKRIDQETFIRQYSTKRQSSEHLFNPSSEDTKLPEEWSLIMKRRDWVSTTPESFHVTIAGRSWMQRVNG